MSEDILEDDIWEYKSIRKPKLSDPRHNSKTTKKREDKGKYETSTPSKTGEKALSKKHKSSQIAKKNVKHKQKSSSEDPESDQNDNQVEGIIPQLPSISSTPVKQNGSGQCKSEEMPKVQPTDGYCPSCQMPFSLLLIQTPRWHVAECLASSGCSSKECPKGIECKSTVPSHYKHYTHFLLAEIRARGEHINYLTENLKDAQESLASASNFYASTENEQTIPQKHKDTLNQRIIIKVKPNALTLLNSDTNRKSTKSKSPGASQKRTSSFYQLDTKGSPQGKNDQPKAPESEESSLYRTKEKDPENFSDGLEAPVIPEFDSSDGEISYSPACSDDEIQSGKKETPNLFYNREYDSENSEHKGYFWNGIKGLDTAKQEATRSQHQDKESGKNDIFEHLTNKLAEKPANKAHQIKQRGTTTSVSPAKKLNDRNKPDWVEWVSPGFSQVKQEPVASGASIDTSQFVANNVITQTLQVKQELGESFQSPQSVVLEELRSYLVNKAKASSSNTSTATTNEISCAHNLKVSASASVKLKSPSLETVTLPNRAPHSSTMTSKSLSSNSSAKSQLASAKGLKQMDIGVFFGFKPKTNEKQQASGPSEKQQAVVKDSPTTVTHGRKKTWQNKRKAEGSIGDFEEVAKSNGIKGDLLDNRYQRTRKRFRGKSTTDTENGMECGTEGKVKKQCPFYKKIPGTAFVVDAFQYGAIEGCTAYFLTHFHSDHYVGLTRSFKYPIYCSCITGNLVKSKLQVEDQYIKKLPMNTACIVDGIKVILLDANHCPGAAMLLFHLPNGTTVLHTGDFRADPSMECYPALIGQKIHTLYLDTTYCSPEYTFPTQEEAITFASSVAFETVTLNPRTLVVCGTYSVGKEKVFLAIADVLGCKVSMSREKYNTMQCLESKSIKSLITVDWDSTQLHVLSMMQVNFKGLNMHLNKFSGKYDQVLAFRPTGWTYSGQCDSVADTKPQTRGNITIYGIPYSEHSSYLEMKHFVQWVRPNKIIPTVNVGKWQARKAMEKLFSEWMSEGTQKKIGYKQN
ncbi:DNA cross-link repair 1A protein [Latimeria chalumnae]|uniref:DNA cross-link repair 1A protein n=1 Tax=Latimeria chalumnae TaxID=7897 RepID=M3XI61_LATCH|nr:PREDICTED: DNA cross-link repair 1A protein [Latimeria chalumnae]|eukprot:XP_006002870.1 PREDICTED: DNA cross-link repair 1A protein [Latimeria chalumnae]